MMKVMLLAYEAPEDFALRETGGEKLETYIGQWYAFGDMLRSKGVYDSGAPLEAPATATTVSVHNGERKVEDGPYPDTKEQLGGFCIVDAPDLETAAAWAAKCPAARNGYIDVRPLMSLDAGGQ